MSTYDWVSAADTANMQAGGQSFFDAGTDFLTKGLGSAVVSGIHAMANTAIDFSNKLFDTGIERYDTTKTLENFDASWAEYYRQNQQLVDGAGVAIGSLIPGTLAVKGLRMAVSAGESAGAFTRVLGFASKEQKYLQAALGDLATEGGTVFNTINKNKMLSMAWGTAEQALQAATYETATLLTMKSSPMLENTEWKDAIWDVAKTSLAGGILGGGINALYTNKIMRDAGKLVAGKQRVYDVLANLDSTSLSFGDKAYSVMDAVAALPTAVLDTKIPFKYAKDGILDTTSLMESTLRASTNNGLLKLKSVLTNAANADTTVGEALAQGVMRMVTEHHAAQLPMSALRQVIGEHLWNLVRADGVGGRPHTLDGSIEYVNPRGSVMEGTAFSRVAKEGYKPYRIIGNIDEATVFTLGKEADTYEEAIRAGADAVLDPSAKTFRVSPFSSIFQELKDGEDQMVSMFLNTRSMQTSFDVVPTAADIATVANPLTVELGGVVSGNKAFSFKPHAFNPDADSIELTARYAWASQPSLKISGPISANDFAMLDALIQAPARAPDGLMVFNATTKTLQDWGMLYNKDAWVFRQKYEAAINLLEKAGTGADLRDLALRLNVEPAWLQKAIDVRFSQAELFADSEGWSRPLAGYLKRENVLLHYDASRLEGAEARARGVVTYAQRVKAALEATANASATVLGNKWYPLLPDLGAEFTKRVDQGTTGPSMVGASNASYADDVRRNAQYIGQLVQQISTERINGALTRLQAPAAKLLENPQAAAEVAAAVTKIRLSPDAFALYSDPVLGQNAIVDLASYKSYLITHKKEFKTVMPLSEDAGAFLKAHAELHAERVQSQGVLQTAQGMEKRWDPERFYVPPVDTRRVPYFAFVREVDGKLFGGSEVAMVTARSSAELRQRVAVLEADSGFQVIYKRGTEEWHKAQADYDFGRVMNSPEIDSFLRKQGKLGDYFPNMTPQAVVEDFIQYTQRAETKLVRDAVSAKYAQQIAELKDLSSRYTQAQQSRFFGYDKWKKDNDPFGDTINLMMNVSKKGQYALWHQANEFVDNIGSQAYRALDAATQKARAGTATWEEANDMMERFGMGRPYKDAEQYLTTQNMGDRNLIQQGLQKANMLLVNGMLRLDAANSLLNVLSTPILLGGEISALRRSIAHDPEMVAKLNSMLTQAVPGTELAVPSATKLIYQAVRNYFGEDKAALLSRYRDIGVVKSGAALFHDMLDDLALRPGIAGKEWLNKVNSWVEKGAVLSGSEHAEEFTRYVTGNVMHQITQPLVERGAMSIAEQNSWISTFVNRVQGNYVAAQRPILFQGTLGSAVGLFQTYQFNMFQQLFRHIENKDMRALAVIGGLQSTLYGLHGLPFFDAINTQLLGGAAGNSSHYDLYAAAVQAFGKDAGNWLMYGTASAFPLFGDKAPALWSRGDLNPRSLSVIPVNPMDVPAVQASIKAVSAVVGMASQLGNDASLRDALLFGLEHNGLNRPLAGLATVFKGNATTNQGDLISASNDFSSIATAARLIGARPLDESIALNTVYRSKVYQAMDKQRIDALGTVIKDKLRGNQVIDPEDWTELMGKYAAAGGRIEGFQQAVRRWDKAANTSLANEVMRHSQTPQGRRMIMLLGGEPLEDYKNLPDQSQQ